MWLKQHIVITIFFGLLAFFVLYRAKRKAFFDFQQKKSIEMPFSYVIGAFLSYFVIPSFIFLVYLAHFRMERTKIIFIGAFVSFICLSFFCLFLKRKSFFSIFYLDKSSSKTILKDIKYGIITLLVAAPFAFFVKAFVSVIVYLFSGFEGAEQVVAALLKRSQNNLLWFSFVVIITTILAPLAEEFIFRGIIQNWLSQHVNKLFSISIASAVFALSHCNSKQGLGNISLFISLFFLSCFLGFIYERQRSLWAPIALHVSFNSFNAIMFLLS